ncbi:MAG: hypothetical protein COA33_010180 [Fluviicola sp.]|nr:hypothetical protein [Fluviicola sp.]
MNNKVNKANKKVNLLPKSIILTVALLAVIVLVISIAQSKKSVEPVNKGKSESISVMSREVSPRISSMFNCRDKKRSTCKGAY